MHYILLFLFIIPYSVQAEDFSFNWLHSTTNQNSALSGNCEDAGYNKVTCSLRQISFSRVKTKKEAAIEMAQARKEFDEKVKKTSIEEASKEFLGDICDHINTEDAKKALKASEVFTYKEMVEICKNPTEKNLFSIIKKTSDIELNTCRVYEVDLGEYTFTKVNNTKWVSNIGPTGECGAIVVMTLEPHSNQKILWNYSQTKQYTNTETKLCKDLEANVEPMGYGWRGKKPLKAECEYIKFGM